MSHSTRNRSFRGQVFPANHLAMVLTKQTYNTQDKHKKPKHKHKKFPKLNLTKPHNTGLVTNKKHSSLTPHGTRQ